MERTARQVSWWVILCWATACVAKTDCPDPIGRVVSIQGVVERERVGISASESLVFGAPICAGDIVRTRSLSRASVRFMNETVIRLDQNTTVVFSAIEEQDKSWLSLIQGILHFMSRSPRRLTIETPFVNAAIEGTEFVASATPTGSEIMVIEGRVRARNDSGELMVVAGEAAAAAGRREALRRRNVVQPMNAVQWAFYYPPLGVASQVSADARGAARLLSVGRSEEARVLLAETIRKNPNDAAAVALQAAIAVAQNRVEDAELLARRAVSIDSDSALAHLALSYVRQAQFNLEAALTSVRMAVQVDPQNAEAWARLAELQSAQGNLSAALKSAQRAVDINPDLSRTQSVLGFAYLIRIELNQAIQAFDRAIRLDQADPLPRLGLGLAQIRRNQLEEGRRQLEIAVSLDPGRSLLRSYLGKAYFEEKRNTPASGQYQLAKDLDPKDPTAWLYEAYLKQSENRPVEALRDVEQSIALNGNRAVYRSRLLLDEDLATRSSSLGRMYNDVRFQRLALVEGWKSTALDPANDSAHRLLADSYAILPRHDIARVSELLQSQLLQPLNAIPIQPQLAEADLNIPEGAGPSEPTFNEFTALFARNRLALQASGVAGGNDTVGNDLALAGLWGPLSLSLGQFHYETDGFRLNNDQVRDSFNLLAQARPWVNTSVLVELRAGESEFGDLVLRFDPELVFADDRTEEKTRSVRFGFRQAFSPASDLIGTVVVNDIDETFAIDPVDFEIRSEESGVMAEAQHWYRWPHLKLASGVGFFESDLTTRTIFLDESSTEDERVQHVNVYLYSYLNRPESITWTIGGSGDFLDGLQDKHRFNPKLGITWNPIESTTLRSSLTRILARRKVANQTIEPTHVAGFNQFFDDLEGDEAWRVGFAVDHRFGRTLWGGLELSGRDLDTLYLNQDFDVREAEWSERIGRAYLAWAPCDWFAGNVSYEGERLERDLASTGEELFHVLDTDTLSVDCGAYFPNGITLQAAGAYVNQEGEFDPNPGSLVAVSGRDAFWVVDVSCSYRLPNRWGRIAIEVKNVLDEQFNFQTVGRGGPAVAYQRLVLAKVAVNL